MDKLEHIGHVVRMSVSGYRGRRFESRQHQYVVSLSKTLYRHCFSRLSCEMSTRWGHAMKGVQSYELFGGIAFKNHAFLCYCRSKFIFAMNVTFIIFAYSPLIEHCLISCALTSFLKLFG